MHAIDLGRLLIYLSLIFLLTFILGYLFSKFRLPSILAALFVGMGLNYTPVDAMIHIPQFETVFEFLADLGVLFLLFYIGFYTAKSLNSLMIFSLIILFAILIRFWGKEAFSFQKGDL